MRWATRPMVEAPHDLAGFLLAEGSVAEGILNGHEERATAEELFRGEDALPVAVHERGLHGALRRHERVHRLRDLPAVLRVVLIQRGVRALLEQELAAIGQSAKLQKPALQLIGRGGGRDGAASALDATRTTRGEGGEPARDGREGRRHRRVPKTARRKSRGAEMETPNPRGSGSRAKINRLRFVDSADASPRAVTRRREGWRTGGTNCRSAGAENASHNARHADASLREPRRSSVILGRLASAKARERGPNRGHPPRGWQSRRRARAHDTETSGPKAGAP